MIIHHFYSIYIKGNKLLFFRNNYLKKYLQFSVYVNNALSGSIFTNVFSRYCAQEMHANCVSQSHDGEEGCVHSDVYTVNPCLTCGVRAPRRTRNHPPINGRKPRRREIAAGNANTLAERCVSSFNKFAEASRLRKFQ